VEIEIDLYQRLHFTLYVHGARHRVDAHAFQVALCSVASSSRTQKNLVLKNSLHIIAAEKASPE